MWLMSLLHEGDWLPLIDMSHCLFLVLLELCCKVFALMDINDLMTQHDVDVEGGGGVGGTRG